MILYFLTSCEEIIEIKLNESKPAFVVEGTISPDSAALVHLSVTGGYFSDDEPVVVEDASVVISDGIASEELSYTGNGYYKGNMITGTEGKKYNLEILYNGKIYNGESLLSKRPEILVVTYARYESQSPLNPLAEVVYTIKCNFTDDPDTDNYYLIHISSKGKLLENYYLLTENSANHGVLTYIENNVISFSESFFCDPGIVDVRVFSIDEPVYNYFFQLNDILYWKRRIMPPTPYNPTSNISNDALGFFAAWAFDTGQILLE